MMRKETKVTILLCRNNYDGPSIVIMILIYRCFSFPFAAKPVVELCEITEASIKASAGDNLVLAARYAGCPLPEVNVLYWSRG